MACPLSGPECFRKYVAQLGATERGKGWYSMRCPIGHHGQPLRFHEGDRVHISWTDLGHCPESDVYAWLTRQGIPSDCLRKPKDSRSAERPGEFGTNDGKLADAILAEAFGEGTSTERLIRVVVLALGGETPEGPIVDVLADKLGLKPRIIYQATAEMRRRNRDW